MTKENFDAALETFFDVRPFQVFTVILKSGKQLEVDHRLSLSNRDGFAVYVGPMKAITVFDHDSVERFINSGIETAV
jgi:hypothetical protein